MDKTISGCVMLILLALSSACSTAPDTNMMQTAPQEEQEELTIATQTLLPVIEYPTENTVPAETPIMQEQALVLSSPLITALDMINPRFTCAGENISPPLEWNITPEGTKSLALVVDDVDAPGGLFVHWVLFNIPADRREIPQAVPRDETVEGIGVQGMNDAGKTGYFGPCPPAGPPHRYYFRLYALDTRLFLNAGIAKSDLEKAMEGHILGQSEFFASYQRVIQKSGG